jgi:hypothetical protein
VSDTSWRSREKSWPPIFFFELLDALAYRRLRTRNALRCPREGAFFNDGEKVLELEEIH